MSYRHVFQSYYRICKWSAYFHAVRRSSGHRKSTLRLIFYCSRRGLKMNLIMSCFPGISCIIGIFLQTTPSIYSLYMELEQLISAARNIVQSARNSVQNIYIYIFIYLFLFIYLYTYIHNLWLKKRRSRLKINQSLYPFAVCEARTPFALSSVIIIMRFTRRTTCRWRDGGVIYGKYMYIYNDKRFERTYDYRICTSKKTIDVGSIQLRKYNKWK